MDYFILFISCLFASTASIFVKFSDLPSIVLLAYRLAFTLIFMLPYVLIYKKSELKNLNKKLLIKTAISGVCFALHLFLFFEALRYTGIAEANILVSSEVLFIAVFELVFLHRGISKKGWLFLFLSCIAAYFVISGGKKIDSGASYPHAFLGNILALCSSILSALYTLIGRNVRKNMSMSVYTSVLYTFSLIVTLIIASIKSEALFGYRPINFVYGAGLAILPTILGHNLFSYSLKHFKSSVVSSAKLTTPVFSTILAWIFFGKYPLPPVIIASVAMIFTIFAYIQAEKSR